MQHRALRLILFLPNDEEVSWLLLLSLVSVLSGSAKTTKNTYSYIISEKAEIYFF